MTNFGNESADVGSKEHLESQLDIELNVFTEICDILKKSNLSKEQKQRAMMAVVSALDITLL